MIFVVLNPSDIPTASISYLSAIDSDREHPMSEYTDHRLRRLETAVFGPDKSDKPAPHPVTDTGCRAPFLSWSDMVEIERALIMAPQTDQTGTTLHRLREELARGERMGVFSVKDRGPGHPKPLRRFFG